MSDAVLFAHGFEGVPEGRKTRYLQERAGRTVIAPRMSRYGWTFEDQVRVLTEALDAHPEAHTAVGSSLGAFALAVAASRRPDRPLNVLLMAPAVGIHECWERMMGEAGMSTWAENRTVTYTHQGVGKDVELPYALYTQCRDHAGVALQHPTIVIHGKGDDVVPVRYALALTVRSPGVGRLIVVDDGHRLLDSLDLMAASLEALEEADA